MPTPGACASSPNRTTLAASNATPAHENGEVTHAREADDQRGAAEDAREPEARRVDLRDDRKRSQRDEEEGNVGVCDERENPLDERHPHVLDGGALGHHRGATSGRREYASVESRDQSREVRGDLVCDAEFDGLQGRVSLRVGHRCLERLGGATGARPRCCE